MKSEPVNVIPEIETNPVVFQQKEPEKKWKTVVKKYANRYFIDAFSGMAQGLFVTLIAGTILKQIGSWCGANSGFGALLILIGNIACTLMGAGIGVGIAKKLKAPDLVVFACAVAGFLGAFLPDKVYNLLSDGSFSLKAVAGSITAFKVGAPGNPIGSYVSTLIALEIVLLVQGKTKLDILIVPLTVMFVTIISMFVAYPAIWFIKVIQKFIEIFGDGATLYYGCCDIRRDGHTFDDAHVFCGNMDCDCVGKYVGRDDACGRRGCRRMRGADGRLCRDDFQRKRRRRTYLARYRHQHVADPQHYETPAHFRAADYCFRNRRTHCDVRVQTSLYRGRRRHGYKRSCRRVRRGRGVERRCVGREYRAWHRVFNVRNSRSRVAFT